MRKFKLVTKWSLTLASGYVFYQEDEIIADSMHEGIKRIEDVETCSANSLSPWRVESVNVSSFVSNL